MQKLSGTSSGKNNKSCGVFHNESNKMSLHFSDFCTIFYGFYNIQQNGNTIEVVVLHRGP
jgi:hypothetical protein